MEGSRTRVQAIDELGRWTDARVTGQGTDEGGDFVDVSFPGYPTDSLRVSVDCVRPAVLPFEQQERVQPIQRCHRRDANVQRYDKLRLSWLNKCERGDWVMTAQGGGVIYTIDPFRRDIILDDGRTVHLLDIVLGNSSTKVDTLTHKKRKRTSRKGHPSSNEGTSGKRRKQSFHQGANVTEHSKVQTEDRATSTPPCERVELQEKSQPQESASKTFCLGSVQCGSVYKVKDMDIFLMVTEINLTTHRCSGWPINTSTNTLQKDVTISVNVTKLETKAQKVNGEIKKVGSAIRADSFAVTVNNCQDLTFRRDFRRSQMMSEIKSNVVQALSVSCRTFKKSFDLGLANVDTDLSLFSVNLGNRSVEYSYKRQNLACLDELLHEHWDLNPGPISRFVTSMKITLTSNFHLQGLIKTAEYPGQLSGNNYRSTILAHLQQIL